MVASGAFWGPKFILQGLIKVYIFFLYIHVIKKNDTGMVASGAFWGRKSVLRDPTKVNFFLYLRI